MFGINSQAVGQDTAVVGSFNQASPLDGNQIGDNLDSTGLTPQGAQTQSSQPVQSPISSMPDPNLVTPTQPTTSHISAPQPSTVGGGNEELIDIKKDALQQLTPLVGHLEQTPEEKFRTTMMLIQATDDKSLLRSAYQSALQIADEKARAQALLDVVNEINYFTHPDAQN